MYLFKKGEGEGPRVQLMGSGAILREVIFAAELLADDFGVVADIWSVLGINQLHREGTVIEDWNRNHPLAESKKSYVTLQLEPHPGPVVMSTDYVQAYCEQIRRFIDRPLTILGTDGYGRSDSRETLRRFFKVDRYQIVLAALNSLVEGGEVAPEKFGEAIQKYGINPDAPHALNS
jgi:pyruvate dehydrogenase E1 component